VRDACFSVNAERGAGEKNTCGRAKGCELNIVKEFEIRWRGEGEWIR